MMSARRTVPSLILALALGLGAYLGWMNMGWGNSEMKDLKRLLGPVGAALVEDCELVAWQPDLNAKPQAYYLRRRVDEAAFRGLAGQAGFTVAPVPALVEAVWRLPPDLAFPGWAAATVPPGAGLQASGSVGEAAVWLRWHDGAAYMVMLPSAP
jgi:hypothetical protein